MNAVTVNQAKENLEQLIAHVIGDAEPMIVVTEAGKRIVLLPLDEYNSWQETLYLLSNPATPIHASDYTGRMSILSLDELTRENQPVKLVPWMGVVSAGEPFG